MRSLEFVPRARGYLQIFVRPQENDRRVTRRAIHTFERYTLREMGALWLSDNRREVRWLWPFEERRTHILQWTPGWVSIERRGWTFVRTSAVDVEFYADGRFIEVFCEELLAHVDYQDWPQGQPYSVIFQEDDMDVKTGSLQIVIGAVVAQQAIEGKSGADKKRDALAEIESKLTAVGASRAGEPELQQALSETIDDLVTLAKTAEQRITDALGKARKARP